MPKITKIEYRGKLKYVTLDGRKFVIKEKKRYDIDKVYQYLEDQLILLLIQTGSHSDLFKK